jgi:DNA-binding NarL/FixJ family response regulator
VALNVIVAVRALLQREGLCAMLGRFPEFDVAAAANAEELLTASAQTDGAVVITDDLASLVATSALGVIVLGEEPDSAVARALLDRGVAHRGYLLSGELRSADELAVAIRRVADGKSAISPRVAVELSRRHRLDDESPIGSLTSRQTAVLAEVATGKSNVAIAAALGITKRAVERHIGAIYPKLGLQYDEAASPRVAASLLYLRAQLATDRAAALHDESAAVRGQTRHPIDARGRR